ncbi:MAG: hypothetical protein HOE30_05255 [Deltaproteobacteria bacterium]|nr:hypothetical protein [Deltaproteobacteria bacterium]
MSLNLDNRRGVYLNIADEAKTVDQSSSNKDLEVLEQLDLVYRSVCALMYNYVPMSGHPGGSISSGRIVASILFQTMDYDMSDPDRPDADIISYAAGHKALGLYNIWALRNEILRISRPDLLPDKAQFQLRLEDLLGFRRNPITQTPLFNKFGVKPLDGHPTPATPFVKLSTGASGVGMATSVGLAFGMMDMYGENAPRIHIVEGEGGLTPGRVSEAMAAAGTASLKNIVLHVDWNQASIDSNHVCRDQGQPGDYVQWNPMELAALNDWNVIEVPNGMDFQQVLAAQIKAEKMGNHQPTAIVYRTTKGWKYGIEGKASHGAGHNLCTDGFFDAVKPFMETSAAALPHCQANEQRCQGGKQTDVLEACFWDALLIIRRYFENNRDVTDALAERLLQSKKRLDDRGRISRKNAPQIGEIVKIAEKQALNTPAELQLAPTTATTLRGELGRVLQYYNQKSEGAILTASADLLGSTSVSAIGKGFGDGYYNADANPDSRTLSIGGICEDAMVGIMAGLSTYGGHMGACSSYSAFLAALGHVPARLHAIGCQARQAIVKEPYKTFILVCAHAGLKTGEDGPTHADPQALQLLQDNFPLGTSITLTPWDPAEFWPLVSTSLGRQPALLAPFVTRPTEIILDREALGLAPANDAVTGLYLLKKAEGQADGTIVLQGSEVAYAFIEEALPLLKEKGIDLNVYYVASAELFNLLTDEQREQIFPEKHAQSAMGITGFTLSTMNQWIQSRQGRKATLHPFQKGHFLGSGQAEMVLAEAGLDGESQFKAICNYLEKG